MSVYSGVEDRARNLAAKAKPGILKIGDNVYTFTFCQRQWIYEVYENGFWLVNFNCKTLAKAKHELKIWLTS